MEGFEEESESDDDESVMTSMANGELRAAKMEDSLEKQADTPIIIISAA